MQKQAPSSILDLELVFSNEKPWPSLLQHQGGFGVVVGVDFFAGKTGSSM